MSSRALCNRADGRPEPTCAGARVEQLDSVTPVYDALWSPCNELAASCLHRALAFRWRRRSKHVPPGRGCGCGVYAASEPDEAATFLEGRTWAETLSDHRVIGTVSLWGRVVEYTRGWRASRAYSKAIYVPAMRAPYWLRAERGEEVARALTRLRRPR
jgi:hypothetical protein